MASWQALYEEPTQLAPDWGHHRIFAPESYRSVRQALTIPVTINEALVVARNFPLCWQAYEDRTRLVALVSAFPGALRFPGFGELPLMMQAFPLVVRALPAQEQNDIWVDRVIPDKPTDIGAPILLDDHKMSTATKLRLRAALQLGDSLGAANDLTDELQAHGLLEPWPLKFDLGSGHNLDRDDLFVLSARDLNSPAFFSLVERRGIPAGLFLSLHRASLFRINWLLSHARGYVQETRAPKRPEEVFE